jgi:hypothetical protein
MVKITQYVKEYTKNCDNINKNGKEVELMARAFDFWWKFFY